jgi:hypothetical protein
LALAIVKTTQAIERIAFTRRVLVFKGYVQLLLVIF